MTENKNLLLLYIICIICYFYISDEDIIYHYELMRWPYLEVLLYCILYIQIAAFFYQFLAEVARRLILIVMYLLIHYLFIKFKK